MTKRIVSLTCLFLMLGMQTDAIEQEDTFNPVPMRECILTHLEFFEARVQSISHAPQREENAAFLDQMRAVGFPAKEWLSRLHELTWTKSLLIKETADIELLIASLYSGDQSIFKFARKRLMWEVGHETRKQYAEQIKAALGDCPSSLNAKWLLAKCGLTDTEKEKLLASKEGRDLVLRALCGDTDAEKEIIGKFNAAAEFDEKRRWVKPMAFIGSKACGEALVDGLASPVFGVSGGGYYSIRHPIVESLRLIYEEEEQLFRGGSSYMASASFIEEMDVWVREEFGHSAWKYKYVWFFEQIFHNDAHCDCIDLVEHGVVLAEQTPASGGPEDGKKWNVSLGGGVGMDFMPIPAGRFQMGSYNFAMNQMPVHSVTFEHVFWMAKTEITQGQYREVMGVNPSGFSGDEYPMHSASRQAAYGFCDKLTERERESGHLPVGYEYTLPSEAQWEYACRAGSEADSVTNLDEVAWHNEPFNRANIPYFHPVARKQPNAWGLYDMLGNVPEWCADCYRDTYFGAPEDGSFQGGGCMAECHGVARGGSAFRKSCRPTERIISPIIGISGYEGYGFRPVLQRGYQNRLAPRDEAASGYSWTNRNDGIAITYCWKEGDITVPASICGIPVTTIKSMGGARFESVIIPDSVTSIGKKAFLNCDHLEEIRIPAGVETIGKYVFNTCDKLRAIHVDANNAHYSSRYGVLFNKDQTKLIQYPSGKRGKYSIPSGVKTIGSSAFCNRDGLTELIIPESVSVFEDGAVQHCNGLTSIVIPNSVTSLGNSAFSQCEGLRSISLPANINRIGRNSFDFCRSLENIEIHDDITSIGDSSFSSCTNLVKVTLPASLASIGEDAFGSCFNLSRIFIPSGVTNIGAAAFSACSRLEAIEVDEANENYCDLNGVLFSKDLTTLINCPSQKEACALPASLTSIGSWAFYGNSSLTNFTVPDGIECIGEFAFGSCTNLTEITLPIGLIRIERMTFYGCENLENISIPPTVTHIGDRAFGECKKLKDVEIPASVTHIGKDVFYSAEGLF